MSIAFVLGNGISRKGISAAWLKHYGTIYGCNALYREFTPDVLVATDKPIATKIQESGYSLENRFHTRQPIEGKGARKLIQSYYGYSSGPNALGLAATDGHAQIYLLGFDMGPTLSNSFNNVYAGTEFYRPQNSTPTYAGNWVKQVLHVAHDFPEINFFRVVGPTTSEALELLSLRNMHHIDLNSFLDSINTLKD